MKHMICLYGGPGSGKSTLAAALFVALKVQGKNVELVHEVAKSWAYEKRPIDYWNQYEIFGKQLKQEWLLHDKVDYIVTDSPLFLQGFYAANFEIELSARNWSTHMMGKGWKIHNFFLSQREQYNPVGRYQTKDEASDVSFDLIQYLNGIIDYKIIESKNLNKTVEDILKNINNEV